MKRFTCPHCGNEVHFDSTSCVACGTALAYDPGYDRMDRADEQGNSACCANRSTIGCNWKAEYGLPLCLSCSCTQTIPDMSAEENVRRLAKIEVAKRNLMRSIVRLGLRPNPRGVDPVAGLAFDFLASIRQADGSLRTVTTGHSNGIITVDLAEADDAERTERRQQLGERYRTLLGHLRHEVGHYFWDRLVADPGLHRSFRHVFGDETIDYAQALERYYQQGPDPDWQNHHVSAYASAHPWEDFAESWAHYLHMTDGLETAAAYGIAPTTTPGGASQALAEPDPYRADRFEAMVETFVPLTISLNAMNRSVGQPDFYPFVLSKPAIGKLRYIHRLLHG